jgi:hypothetical protein
VARPGGSGVGWVGGLFIIITRRMLRYAPRFHKKNPKTNFKKIFAKKIFAKKNSQKNSKKQNFYA